MKKQKVYTFFEPIEGWDNDYILLELWTENWQKKGFETVILRKSDAESHPYYEEFLDNISSTYIKVMGRSMLSRDHPWDYYVLHNYIRFLAYANFLPKGDPGLVMDYDVYNINYINHDNLNRDSLTFLYGTCPCLVSGNSNHFLSYCRWMADTPQNFIESLKLEFAQSSYTNLHEMALLQSLHNIDSKTTKHFTFTTHNSKLLSVPQESKKALVHVSNEYLTKYLKEINIDIKTIAFSERVKYRSSIVKKLLSE